MLKGVGLPASGRRWGRAGVVVLALLGACGPSAVVSAPPTGRSVGADAIGEAPTDPPVVADAPIAPPPDLFDGAPAPAVAPPPELARAAAPEPTGSGVWAVIVGIDDYPGTSHDLESAVNDANDMDVALGHYRVPPERRVRLLDGQANAATIARGLDWLTAHAGPDATAVFFFAGHVRKLSRDTEALVGADGNLITDREVAAHLSNLRAGRTWLVIAACYGGGFTEALAPGRILTAAASADQIAYESESFHRSYLVEYLVSQAILQGRADSSVEAAFAWAAATLRRDHPDRVPVQFDELPGDLVLGPTAPLVAPPRAARADPPPSSTTTTTARPASKPPDQRQGCVVTVGSAVRCTDG